MFRLVSPVSIGTPFTTQASFGTPQRGGESSFWTQVLSELERDGAEAPLVKRLTR